MKEQKKAHSDFEATQKKLLLSFWIDGQFFVFSEFFDASDSYLFFF